jgi:hypothetical protein
MTNKRPGGRYAPLERLATEQHGIVSMRQLTRLGLSRSSASEAVRSGRLHRIHRGVYAVGHHRLTWEGHCLAAVLAHEPALASHTSAAWLWELLDTRPTSYEFTAAHRRRSAPGLRFHAGMLRKVDICERRGIPVTAVPRTLLDMAGRRRQVPSLDRLLHRAAELERLDRRQVEALLDRTMGHPGHPRLREALRIYRPRDRLTRSDLERRFLTLVEAAGLPLPASNFLVGAYELDCYWPERRFAVELDVFATHGSPLAFERDRERTDDLLALGVEMIRVTDVRLEREPETVIARVAAHLARRGLSPPPGRVAPGGSGGGAVRSA